MRPESADEARAVADICAALGVPHRTLAVEVAAGNVQSEARKARYAALVGWASERGLIAVATAHHADDQAETLLMRLNRASGLRGLASIRTSNWIGGTMIVRPLLLWRKTELVRIVADAGIVAAADPSNVDPRFDRARLRAALAEADWLDPGAIARSAAHLADAEFALNWATDREWEAQVGDSADGYRYTPLEAPLAIRLGVLERMIAFVGGNPPRGGELAALEERLCGGGKATLGGAIVEVRRGEWTVLPEPGRR